MGLDKIEVSEYFLMIALRFIFRNEFDHFTIRQIK